MVETVEVDVTDGKGSGSVRDSGGSVRDSGGSIRDSGGSIAEGMLVHK
jgi:hypothetical protein